MTRSEIISDALFLIYANELMANEVFSGAVSLYKDALTEAENVGLIVKNTGGYTITAKAVSIIDSGKTYHDYLKETVSDNAQPTSSASVNPFCVSPEQ